MALHFNGLESDRLILKPFTVSLISEKYISWLKDPEVVRYSVHRNAVHDTATCASFLKNMHDSGNLFSAIFLKQPLPHLSRHIGNIVANFDFPNQTADMTILLGEREIWGKGFGGEAWAALMNYLIADRGIRKITAGAVEQNQAMLQIFWSSGMHEEARRRRQYIVDGQEVDLIYAARFRDSKVV